MAALTRKFKKIFGKDSSQNGVFGSKALGAPAVSTNPETIESLSAFLDGWDDATLAGLKLPCLEDMQGLKYDTDYHLAYMYQAGIAEYNNLTEYTTDSVVRESGTVNLYKSIANENTGNPLSDATKWALCGNLSNIPATPALSASVMVGSISAFPCNTAPSGWLECNGSLVSRTTYSALWNFAQTSGNITANDGAWTAGKFSPGNGTTTFRIPDFRGYFVRGWANTGSIDSGRIIGSTQNDGFASHTHTATVTDPGHSHTSNQNFMGGGGNFVVLTKLPGNQPVTNGEPATTNISVNNSSTGGTETRPINISLMYCIKT
jgi:microcystin-dependent protein